MAHYVVHLRGRSWPHKRNGAACGTFRAKRLTYDRGAVTCKRCKAQAGEETFEGRAERAAAHR
jgi:hypothetical protein